MANLGKRILSAFVEVTNDEQPVERHEEVQQIPAIKSNARYNAPQAPPEKFIHYFDKLFREADIARPDYYEFAKMTEAMGTIADEKARFSAAYAGLHVQGLDKQKLLATAAQYLAMLDKDAASFNTTVDAALQEKVTEKQREVALKQQRVGELSKEITELQNSVAELNRELKESEEKIEANTSGYKAAWQLAKNRVAQDIEKIKQHIA